MLSFECIKNEKSVYFLLTSASKTIIAHNIFLQQILGVDGHKHSICPNGSAAKKMPPSHKIFHKEAKSFGRPPFA